MAGFVFKFKSGNDIDEDWNADADGIWDMFSHTDYVPFVGDVVNFWYILTQMETNYRTFRELLKDYNTAIFKVVKREYCPLASVKNGIWNLYYLTLKPVIDPKISYHLEFAEKMLKREGYIYDAETDDYYKK